MTDDWLLVETLGREPAVVAVGRQLLDLVPVTTFLRRNARRAAIQSAIAESLHTSKSLVSLTPKKDRVIRTEPVVMPDGRVHGVHVWSGPADDEPPERPTAGPLKWDMTLGVATDTPESLAIIGRNSEAGESEGRAFAECWPAGDLKPNEGKALGSRGQGRTGARRVRHLGRRRLAGQLHQSGLRRPQRSGNRGNGRDHLVARGMNWRGRRAEPRQSSDRLAQQSCTAYPRPGCTGRWSTRTTGPC